uniref:Uncharacterized protein n=1 Tax=Gorilla gorilla gorilla TaxID=9595 RepID=G3QDE0_GORGO
MVSNFFHVIQIFEKSATLISKTEHIGFVIYSWRKSTTHLGSRRKFKYDCPFSGTSFVVFSLFLVCAMAGDVVYADIKTFYIDFNCLSSFFPISFNFSTVHKSCPAKDWKGHKGKCYWIKSWNKSQNDCAINNSYLMVIQDITAMLITFLLYLQMAFLQCVYISDVSVYPNFFFL